MEPGCEQFATHVASDQELANGVLMTPAERLHCRNHAERFAAEPRRRLTSSFIGRGNLSSGVEVEADYKDARRQAMVD